MKIEIQQHILHQLKILYKESLPKETGGILFGYYSADLEIAHVTDVYFNIVDSKKSNWSFVRGKNGFSKYAKIMWGKNRYYLGEWHSHPESTPYMSIQDKKQMIEIKYSKNMKCPEPILLIIGEKKSEFLISTYIFCDKEVVFNEMKI